MTTVHLGVSTFVTYPHQDDTRTLPLRLPATVHSIEGLQLTTSNGDERNIDITQGSNRNSRQMLQKLHHGMQMNTDVPS